MKQQRPALHLLAAGLFFVAGCAVIQPPSGGTRDTKPPYAVEYNPDSAAVNFHDKKISIRFNEYIQLSDLNNQLIISPPQNTLPDVEVRQKTLLIKWNDTLRPNTTYTVNFGNSIHDITENNARESFSYVFSTGAVIDSLRISGKVVNAFSNVGEKGALVMLYDQQADSLPYKKRPVYFSKTRDDGSFTLTNLHNGKYKLFALADANNNYLYDIADERIAFQQEEVTVEGGTKLDTLRLRLFHEEKSNAKLKKITQPFIGKIVLEFSQPQNDPSLTPLTTLPAKTHFRYEITAKKDSMICWLNDFDADSLLLQVKDGSAIVDTAAIRVLKPEKKSRGKGATEDQRKFIVIANFSREGKFNLRQPVVLKCSSPLSASDLSKIEIHAAFEKIKPVITLDKSTGRFITIDAPLQEDSAYHLFVPPGALTDFFGQKNDSMNIPFTLRSYSEYGSVKLALKNVPEGKHYLLQLLDEKANVLKEIAVDKPDVFTFDLLLPGAYGLRLVDDANRNGKWDTGNYLAKLQPEKVFYYSTPVKIRAGWDMDVEWQLK